MIKKEDGTFIFKAANEDFPQKHKAPILNIGIAETGTQFPKELNSYLVGLLVELILTSFIIGLLQESSS